MKKRNKSKRYLEIKRLAKRREKSSSREYNVIGLNMCFFVSQPLLHDITFIDRPCEYEQYPLFSQCSFLSLSCYSI